MPARTAHPYDRGAGSEKPLWSRPVLVDDAACEVRGGARNVGHMGDRDAQEGRLADGDGREEVSEVARSSWVWGCKDGRQLDACERIAWSAEDMCRMTDVQLLGWITIRARRRTHEAYAGTGGEIMTKRETFATTTIVVCVLFACLIGPLMFSQEAGAAFPGRNGMIAGCSTGGVQAVRPDGSDGRFLTGYLGEACGASFSPDGGRIVYYGDPDEDGFYQLFVKDLRNGQQTQITRGTSEDTPGQGWRRPSWSPDGSKIAFDRGGEGVWVMDVDGSNQRQITNAGWNPEWSPDGTRIAYASSRGADHADVWVMNADGSNETRLTRSPSLNDQNPEWSPSGDKIAWEKQEETNGRYQVYKMRPDGTEKTRLTGSAVRGSYSPAWSPDGRKITFLQDGRLVKMNADGTGKKLVTATFNGLELDWRPLPAPAVRPTDPPS